MAIASVPVAPLFCLFGSTVELTEKYFTPSAINFSITAFTWEPLIASVESSAIRPAATFFNWRSAPEEPKDTTSPSDVFRPPAHLKVYTAFGESLATHLPSLS